MRILYYSLPGAVVFFQSTSSSTGTIVNFHDRSYLIASTICLAQSTDGLRSRQSAVVGLSNPCKHRTYFELLVVVVSVPPADMNVGK